MVEAGIPPHGRTDRVSQIRFRLGVQNDSIKRAFMQIIKSVEGRKRANRVNLFARQSMLKAHEDGVRGTDI